MVFSSSSSSCFFPSAHSRQWWCNMVTGAAPRRAPERVGKDVKASSHKCFQMILVFLPPPSKRSATGPDSCTVSKHSPRHNFGRPSISRKEGEKSLWTWVGRAHTHARTHRSSEWMMHFSDLAIGGGSAGAEVDATVEKFFSFSLPINKNVISVQKFAACGRERRGAKSGVLHQISASFQRGAFFLSFSFLFPRQRPSLGSTQPVNYSGAANFLGSTIKGGGGGGGGWRVDENKKVGLTKWSQGVIQNSKISAYFWDLALVHTVYQL